MCKYLKTAQTFFSRINYELSKYLKTNCSIFVLVERSDANLSGGRSCLLSIIGNGLSGDIRPG